MLSQICGFCKSYHNTLTTIECVRTAITANRICLWYPKVACIDVKMLLYLGVWTSLASCTHPRLFSMYIFSNVNLLYM